MSVDEWYSYTYKTLNLYISSHATSDAPPVYIIIEQIFFDSERAEPFFITPRPICGISHIHTSPPNRPLSNPGRMRSLPQLLVHHPTVLQSVLRGHRIDLVSDPERSDRFRSSIRAKLQAKKALRVALCEAPTARQGRDANPGTRGS